MWVHHLHGQGMGVAPDFTWVKPAMMMKMTTATCTTVMTAHGSTGRGQHSFVTVRDWSAHETHAHWPPLTCTTPCTTNAQVMTSTAEHLDMESRQTATPVQCSAMTLP